MNSKAIRYGAVALVLAIAAYWYWSPLLAVHQLQSAAKAGDADTFNDHVDYPRLRESLKGQLTAAFTEHMASQQAPDNDFGKAGAALGAMLGMAMVDKMVDAFVRPETVMRAMQEGKMVPRRPADTASEPGSVGDSDNKVSWSSERKSVDKYIAYASKPGDTANQRIGLVLERSGFATWKMTEIRVPALLGK